MGKIVISKTAKGFNFKIYADNKEVIGVSSQIYTTKASAKSTIAGLAKVTGKVVAENKFEDQTLKKPVAQTCPKAEIYLDKAGMFRYRVIANNGENVLISENGYKTKDGCKNGVVSVSKNAINPVIVDETLDK